MKELAVPSRGAAQANQSPFLSVEPRHQTEWYPCPALLIPWLGISASCSWSQSRSMKNYIMTAVLDLGGQAAMRKPGQVASILLAGLILATFSDTAKGG
jgi:hypothetical protein